MQKHNGMTPETLTELQKIKARCKILEDELKQTGKRHEKIRENEARYRLAIEISGDGVWETQYDKETYYFSDTMFTMLGYEPVSPDKAPAFFDSILHPEDRHSFKETLKSLNTPGNDDYETEIRLKSKSGEWKYILTRGKCIRRGTDGKALHTAGTNTDITGRKKEEEQFRQYELMISAVYDQMAFLDTQYRYKVINDTYLKLFPGKLRTDVIGNTPEYLFGKELYKKVIEPNLKKCLKGKEVHYSEWFDMPGKGKTYRDVSYYPLFSTNDSVSGIIIISHDITKHKTLENSLRESEQHYRLLADNIGDTIWILDSELRFSYLSPSAEALTGYTLQELKERAIFDFLPPESHKIVTDTLQEEKDWKENNPEGHFFKTIELRINQKSGESIWIEATIKPFMNGDDDQTGYIGIARNIEKRKQIEDALRESEEQYRGIFNSARDAFVIYDFDGNIIDANPAACDMYGYPREKLITPTGHDVVASNKYHIFEQFMKEVKKNGYFESESIDTRPDGTQIHIDVKAGPLEYKGRPHMLAVIRDISERRRTAHKLQKTYDTLQAIIQASPYAMFDLDRENNVLSLWNKAAENIFGWKQEEIIGKPLPFIRQDKTDEFENLLEIVLSGKSSTGINSKHIRKDGTEINIETAAAPLYNTDGSVAGVMAIVADVTEHLKMEEQFIQSQKMETVGRLAGGIAHDFNNLLTVIMGNAELAELEIPPEHPVCTIIREIGDTAVRASSLTRQLLAFSRRQIIEPKLLNLNETLFSMDKMLRRLIGEDIELVTLPDENLWPVKADTGQIEQVIINLVVNARDAMPDGGKLTIETNNVRLSREYISTHLGALEGDYIMIAVSDTGTGMNEEIRAHIFEPFFTTKEKGKGTGLGLSTCYGIIKQNEGTPSGYTANPDRERP